MRHFAQTIGTADRESPSASATQWNNFMSDDIEAISAGLSRESLSDYRTVMEGFQTYRGKQQDCSLQLQHDILLMHL
jgi:hypothetical protein